VLEGVYHIPRLTANIVSLGQLDEERYAWSCKNGVLKIWDKEGRLLAKVSRALNRLYILKLDIDKPVCLAAQGGDTAWRWHARFGHLNFRALEKLACDATVRGLPPINHFEQVCNSCLAGKQRSRPFLSEAKYRAKEKLELVHGDICGPVTPATPRGNKLFLLLVDNLSRYCGLFSLAARTRRRTRSRGS
jgi:hypothetical protein